MAELVSGIIPFLLPAFLLLSLLVNSDVKPPKFGGSTSGGKPKTTPEEPSVAQPQQPNDASNNPSNLSGL